MGYNPWNRKESDRTEQLTHTQPTVVNCKGRSQGVGNGNEISVESQINLSSC